MESQEKVSFQIPGNHYNNRLSEFVYHTTLKTTAHLTRPNYAKVSATSNGSDTKVLGIKTSQNVMQVIYKNGEFKDHKKIIVDDERLEKQVIMTFQFKQSIYTPSNPSSLIVGYRSGLVSYIDCKRERVLGLYNCDERDKTIQKNQPVSLLCVLPKPNDDEVLVMFEDSTATRYRLGSQSQNLYFVEKIKKFEAKTSFNKALNRFKHRTKTKEDHYYSGYLNDLKPECSNFYAASLDAARQNPLAYYKFNHRTITDVTIRRHKSFVRTLWRDSRDEEAIVLAVTSLDGYVVLFEMRSMKPLLSYQSVFGGINSLAFSENCEMLALGGQDDNITVLDLNTLTTLVCEGHKSFVSRALFHMIPVISDPVVDDKNGKVLTVVKNTRKDEDYVRIIGGGMDAMLSFWEFRRDIFGTKRWLKADESQFPIKLEQAKMPKATVIKPLHMEGVQDAIGWIELCDNMLVQGGYDGGISTYIIRDVTAPSPPRKPKKVDDEKKGEAVGKRKEKTEKGNRESVEEEKLRNRDKEERKVPERIGQVSSYASRVAAAEKGELSTAASVDRREDVTVGEETQETTAESRVIEELEKETREKKGEERDNEKPAEEKVVPVETPEPIVENKEENTNAGEGEVNEGDIKREEAESRAAETVEVVEKEEKREEAKEEKREERNEEAVVEGTERGNNEGAAEEKAVLVETSEPIVESKEENINVGESEIKEGDKKREEAESFPAETVEAVENEETREETTEEKKEEGNEEAVAEQKAVSVETPEPIIENKEESDNAGESEVKEEDKKREEAESLPAAETVEVVENEETREEEPTVQANQREDNEAVAEEKVESAEIAEPTVEKKEEANNTGEDNNKEAESFPAETVEVVNNEERKEEIIQEEKNEEGNSEPVVEVVEKKGEISDVEEKNGVYEEGDNEAEKK